MNFKQDDSNTLPTYLEVIKGEKKWLINHTEVQNVHITRLNRIAIVTIYEGDFKLIKDVVLATVKRD